MTLIANLQPGLLNLVLVDKTQPVLLTVQISVSGIGAACQTQYGNTPADLPQVTIKDVSGNILKQWVASTSTLSKGTLGLSVSQDISSLVQSLEIVDIEFGAVPCEAFPDGVEDLTSVTIAASLNYTSLPYNNTNVQSLTIPGYLWGIGLPAWPGTNLDLSLWDGESSVVLQTILTSNDGNTGLYINGTLVASSDSILSPTENVNQDISAYVKQGINTVSIVAGWYHSNPVDFTNDLGFSDMVFSFNSAAPIPVITANASVQNNEVQTVNALTSVLSGALSVYTNIASTLEVDTHGLASPSVVTIQDASTETKIPISQTMSGDVESFPVDFYMVVNGVKYFLETLTFQVSVTVTDFRPVISIADTNLYVTADGTNFIGTVICSFQVDNSKGTSPVTINTGIIFFGESDDSFTVPAGAIMVASISHSFVGSVAATNSTAIGISVICAGIDGPSATVDPPANNVMILGTPPTLPQPVFSTPGSTSGQVPPTQTPPVIATPTPIIVLSTDEKIVIGGAAAATAFIALAVFLGRKKK